MKIIINKGNRIFINLGNTKKNINRNESFTISNEDWDKLDFVKKKKIEKRFTVKDTEEENDLKSIIHLFDTRYIVNVKEIVHPCNSPSLPSLRLDPFIGWGQKVITTESFNTILLKSLICSEEDVVKIKLEIRKENTVGDILVTSIIDINLEDGETGDLKFSLVKESKLVNLPAGNYFIGYIAYSDSTMETLGVIGERRAENDIHITTYYLTNLDDTWVEAFGNSSLEMQLANSSIDEIKVFNKIELENTLNGVVIDDEIEEEIIPTYINLPDYIPMVVGHEMNIYFNNIVEERSYNIDIICSVGKHRNNRWTLIPEESDIGEHSFQVKVYNKKVLISSKTVTLNIVSESSKDGDNIKALLIGDSTTSNGIIAGELINLFSSDVTNLDLLGTLGTGDAEHEGRGGWTVNEYITGDTSPFVHEGSYNFANYLTNIGDTPDIVYINLGINDMFGMSLESNDFTILLARFQTMVEGILDSGISDVRICLTIPPSYHQDSFGHSYDSNQAHFIYRYNNIKFVNEMIEEFSDKENIKLVPINLNLDTQNNMNVITQQINARNTNTRIIQVNGVHPARIGYEQIADVIYYDIKSN